MGNDPIESDEISVIETSRSSENRSDTLTRPSDEVGFLRSSQHLFKGGEFHIAKILGPLPKCFLLR